MRWGDGVGVDAENETSAGMEKIGVWRLWKERNGLRCRAYERTSFGGPFFE